MKRPGKHRIVDRKTPRSGKSTKSRPSAPRATPQRASEIRSSIIVSKDATNFFGNWIAFNAYYGGGPDPELRRAMNAVQDGISSAAATRFLETCKADIAFFRRLPPGDMRLAANAEVFRRASTQHLAIVFDESVDVVVRASHVIGVVYQVRCNLMHGQKNMNYGRNQRLVRVSNNVLSALWKAISETSEEGITNS